MSGCNGRHGEVDSGGCFDGEKEGSQSRVLKNLQIPKSQQDRSCLN